MSLRSKNLTSSVQMQVAILASAIIRCIFLAKLVALHFTPVSDSVGRWLIVSDQRSLELASLLLLGRINSRSQCPNVGGSAAVQKQSQHLAQTPLSSSLNKSTSSTRVKGGKSVKILKTNFKTLSTLCLPFQLLQFLSSSSEYQFSQHMEKTQYFNKNILI